LKSDTALNNNNNKSNNKLFSKRITRSHVRNISSNNSNPLKPKITVDIPRKENDYYFGFRKIPEDNIGLIAYINLIKESNQEPKNYKEASTGPKALYWDIAMKAELEELENQNC